MSKCETKGVAFLGLILMAFLGAAGAQAQTPLVELGVGQSIYSDNDSHTDWNYQLRFGMEELPVYGTVGYDSPRYKLLGQPLADTDLLSVGLGARKSWGDILGYVETGWTFVDTSVNALVQEEIVYTNLVGRHAVRGVILPVTPGDYETSWEADDALFLRVGVQYQLMEHLAVGASYRFLQVDTEMKLYDQDNYDRGLGYWREDNTVDFGAAEVNLVFTY